MNDLDCIKIVFAGDFIPDEATCELVNNGRMDEFAPEVRELFQSSDLVVVNLETPLTSKYNPIDKNGVNYSAHPANAYLMQDLGIDIVCLANNHILDQSEQGVLDTIEACEQCGIKTVGAAKNLLDSRAPYIVNIKGKEIGFVNICEQEFSIATSSSAGASPIDLINNYRDIVDLREKVDFLILSIHGGVEFHHYPTLEFKRQCEFYVDIGVDVVIGHHPHYIQGAEHYKGGCIYYSIGNFYADIKLNDENLSNGVLCELNIYKNRYDVRERFIKIVDLSFGGIHLDTSEIKKSWFKDISENASSPSFLIDYWEMIFLTERMRYLSLLNSPNRFIYRILKRLGVGYLSFFKRNVYMNILRCDSHRFMLLNVLKKIV